MELIVLLGFFICKDVRTYLSGAYQAFDKWDESLSSEILQKTNISMYKAMIYQIK
jgi:hypothetical protein